MLTKSKIEGLFFGIAIGDALGIPVESYSKERIEKEFGRITKYKSAKNHKYMGTTIPGTWSDDTQLTLAVAQSIIESKGFDIENQIKWHIKAFDETTAGWGKSTRFSVMNLKNGATFPECSRLDFLGAGSGNGVPMKIAPLGLLEAIAPSKSIIEDIVKFSSLTHSSKMAAISGLIHVGAIRYLLWCSPDRFDKEAFMSSLSNYLEFDLSLFNELNDSEDDIKNLVLKRVFELDKSIFTTPEHFIKEFNGGTCYVYNSLPFCYSFFLYNPYQYKTFIDIVNAGGDTDTNASIVGGMLGALHGIEFFPEILIETLDKKDHIKEIVDKFCDTFEVK